MATAKTAPGTKPSEQKPAVQQQAPAQPPAQQNAAPAQQAQSPEKQISPVEQLRQLMVRQTEQIRQAIPRGTISPERLMRCAVTEFQKNPVLAQCTPRSILSCTVQAAQLGLEIGAALGQCYMVPYWNKKSGVMEAQFQVGYRGMVSLAHRSGRVDAFYAHIVYAGDEFDIMMGDKPRIHHKPLLVGNRGKPVLVYAVLKIKGSEQADIEWMSWDAIQAHAAKYSKAYKTGPWQTATDEMSRKTVLLRLAKRAPVSVDMVDAIEAEEAADAVLASAGGATDRLLNSLKPQQQLAEPENEAVKTEPEQKKDDEAGKVVVHPDDAAKLQQEERLKPGDANEEVDDAGPVPPPSGDMSEWGGKPAGGERPEK